MRSRRTTSGITRGTSNAASSGMSVLGEQVHATLPLLLGVELIRADVAATVLGVGLGDVPCGGPITWALLIDGAVAGRTDEPLTDEAAAAGGSPLLRAVEWGTTSFIISDHVGTWVDLEPVG